MQTSPGETQVFTNGALLQMTEQTFGDGNFI